MAAQKMSILWPKGFPLQPAFQRAVGLAISGHLRPSPMDAKHANTSRTGSRGPNKGQGGRPTSASKAAKAHSQPIGPFFGRGGGRGGGGGKGGGRAQATRGRGGGRGGGRGRGQGAGAGAGTQGHAPAARGRGVPGAGRGSRGGGGSGQGRGRGRGRRGTTRR
jgi:hypothetical protein